MSIECEAFLTQARLLCQQRKVRMTPQRHEVLRLMAQQQSAISAYDLLDLLRASKPQAKPPTVYRALDFLLEQGFIHRVESTNSFLVCHHFAEPAHTSVMLICNRCGNITEQHAEGVQEMLKTLAGKMGFIPDSSIIEAHGCCAKCTQIRTCKKAHQRKHNHSRHTTRKQGRGNL